MSQKEMMITNMVNFVHGRWHQSLLGKATFTKGKWKRSTCFICNQFLWIINSFLSVFILTWFFLHTILWGHQAKGCMLFWWRLLSGITAHQPHLTEMRPHLQNELVIKLSSIFFKSLLIISQLNPVACLRYSLAITNGGIGFMRH